MTVVNESPAVRTVLFFAQGNGEVDGSKPADAAEQDPDSLTGNTKLWLGKDYSNFIKKDWVQLDRPFEGDVQRQTQTGRFKERCMTEGFFVLFVFFFR